MQQLLMDKASCTHLLETIENAQENLQKYCNNPTTINYNRFKLSMYELDIAYVKAQPPLLPIYS